MGRLVLLVAAAAVVAIALVCTLQHAHYLSARRKAAQDRQPLFYPAESFHVVSFVRVRDPDDLTASLRRLHAAAQGGILIYAGKVVVNVPSAQIGAIEWSGVLLTQYPSRAAYETARASEPYGSALERFEAYYEHGMRRDAVSNLLLPQALLLRRIAGFLRPGKSPYPFHPAPDERMPPRGKEMVARLRAANDLGRRAAIVFNLQRRGTPEQEAEDARYTRPMLNLMAQRGYGPLHLGVATALPDGRDFDRVAIVYYPGTVYFAEMFSSTFYQTILGRKQLGDNQSTITVPITDMIGPSV